MSVPGLQVVPLLPIGLFNADRLDDAALRRAALGASSAVAFRQKGEGDVSARWAVVNPDVPIEDGGEIGDVRDAILGCAQRKIVVLASSTPDMPERFVGRCLQGAAASTEFEIAGVAVHVLRNGGRSGRVAWLTDTGEMSGYGLLYAVSFAQLLGSDVLLVEPTEGTKEPRTPEAEVRALEVAASAGVAMRAISDASPLDRVLRGGDDLALIVHPVLDAPGGRQLLHPRELPGSSVAKGNPAAVVRLINEFDGDVTAVYDGVHLVYGHLSGAKAAAAVTLGLITVTGVGMVAPTAASASTTGATGNTAVVLVDGSGQTAATDAVTGLRFVAHPHTGGGTDLEIQNTSDHTVMLTVSGYHGHGGSEATTQTVTLQPGQTQTVHAGGGVKHWGDATLESVDRWVLTQGIVLMNGENPIHFTPQLVAQVVAQAVPDSVVVTAQPPQTIETLTQTTTPTEIPEPTVVVPSQVPQQTPPALTQQAPTPMVAPPLKPQEHVVVTAQPPQTIETLTPTTTPIEIPGPTVWVPSQVPQAMQQRVPQVATDQQTPMETPAATSTTPAVATTTGVDQLAHTGAGSTALLAGLAAALVAGGAGLIAAAKEDKGDSEAAPTEG